MKKSSKDAPDALHTALSNLVKIYQFRSRDENLHNGVTVSQAYCLRALWKYGEMKMGELAQDLSLSISTMTGVVDQLVKKSLVERFTPDNDRRILLVKLTQKGQDLYEASNAKFQKQLEKAIAGRNDNEKQIIIQFLNDVTEVIQDWRKGHE